MDPSDRVVRARGGIRVRQWLDDAVAFDSASSATHLLSLEAAAVLALLGSSALPSSAVHGRLIQSDLFDPEDTSLWGLSETHELLGEMIRLRLVLADPV